MKDNFLYELLAKIGLTPTEREKVIENFKKLIYITILSTLKDSLPEDRIKDLTAKIQSADDWDKLLAEEAKKSLDKEKLFTELAERLNKSTEEFFKVIVEECPDDKKAEAYQYLSQFASPKN